MGPQNRPRQTLARIPPYQAHAGLGARPVRGASRETALALEMDLAKSSNSLVLARRVHDRQVKQFRLANPFCKSCMVRKIIISKRMNKGSQARRFEQGNHAWQCRGEELNFVLWLWVGTNAFLVHLANEDQARQRVVREPGAEVLVKLLRHGSRIRVVINVGMERVCWFCHYVPLR